jgi:cysteine-rich repeat protein
VAAEGLVTFDGQTRAAGEHGELGGMGGGPLAGGSGGIGGGQPPTSICGNGLIESGEECDDGDDSDPEDGCHDCVVLPGYECDGEPSQCTPIPAVVQISGPGLNHHFAANAYDGSLASMECIELLISAPANALVQRVEVELGIDSGYIGDLVFKVVSPQPKVVTLMSRPGMAEPADDGTGNDSDSSNLTPSAPVRFYDDATYDAEMMGNTLGGYGEVCKDDNQCDFKPNPGAAIGGPLGDFIGNAANGIWRVCAADADGSNGGTIDLIELSVLAW